MSAAPKIRIFESEVQNLPIDDLKIDEKSLQSRAETDPEIVRIYSERRRGKPKQPGSPFPPVLVFLINGIFWLADGFHRVAAARKLGEQEVPCIVRKGTMLDAILAGAQINSSKENLRGYQDADRRRLVELLIRCGAGRQGEGSWDWSDVEIARRAGCNPAMVSRIRPHLKDAEGIPIPEKVQRFINGKPTGKFQKYRLRAAGIPSIYSDDYGRFFTQLGKKNVYLGYTEEEANRNLKQLIEERNNTQGFLMSVRSFAGYLTKHNIGSSGIDRTVPFGGCRIGDAYVTPMATADDAISAVGRCCLALTAFSWCKRLIVCGYYRDDCRSGKVAAIAHRFAPVAVEFMAPEELVAESGPKGGVPDAGAEDQEP